MARGVVRTLGLKTRIWLRDWAICSTSSLRTPSSSSCLGSTFTTPISVAFIIRIPSVNTDIACVARATSPRSASCAYVCCIAGMGVRGGVLRMMANESERMAGTYKLKTKIEGGEERDTQGDNLILREHDNRAKQETKGVGAWRK